MVNPRLLGEKRQIDVLIQDIQSFSGDPYIQSLLAYYLCVRISGFLENCVRIIFTDYASPRTKDHAQEYVASKLQRFPNPTFENICRLAKEFNDQWNTDLKARATPQLRSSLQSIMNNRHNIAHGGTSTVTLRQLISYYNDLIQLVDSLEQICI